VGDREILETYSDSASKNTTETDIFPHGPNSLLTSVIGSKLDLILHFTLQFTMKYSYSESTNKKKTLTIES